MNLRIKDGAIQLTHIVGNETALLTVRGKDHDLTESELTELGKECLRRARAIELDGRRDAKAKRKAR